MGIPTQQGIDSEYSKRCRYIGDQLRLHLSNASRYYPSSLDEFLEFGRRISPKLAAIASSQKEVDAALGIIEGRIGAVEVEATDGWTLHGDHHAYPSFAVKRFEVEDALALAENGNELKRLIEELVKKGRDRRCQA